MTPITTRGSWTDAATVVVVGSGAGGGAAAWALARAGHDVLVLEMGEHQAPATFDQREENMLARLFQDAGSRASVDYSVGVLQGKGVGGSTLHNLNLCKRLDPELLDVWVAEHGLAGLPARMSEAYDVIERTLQVSEVEASRMNANNRVVRDGARALGWRNGPLRHNRVGCVGSGFCELGCAYDAKMNSARVLLPEASARGARIRAAARVTRIEHAFGRVTGVSGVALDAAGAPVGSFRVRCDAVVLAASATASSALALASAVPDPGRRIGRGLTLHPGATVGGLFNERIEGWKGIPQSWECTEHLHPTDPERRIWIVPVFGHPVGVAAMLPATGALHTRLMGQFAHLAAVTPMLHDSTFGHVTADREGRPRIHYTPNAADLRMMARGLAWSAELLLAGGAREVWLPTAPPLVVRTLVEARALHDRPARVLDPPLAAVHPMGGLAMGGAASAPVDPTGRARGLRGLWVADGSLFPSSTGVPPQISIYALGLLTGQACAASLSA
jgi:choline dehydrogenase-like flavoprotein